MAESEKEREKQRLDECVGTTRGIGPQERELGGKRERGCTVGRCMLSNSRATYTRRTTEAVCPPL